MKTLSSVFLKLRFVLIEVLLAVLLTMSVTACAAVQLPLPLSAPEMANGMVYILQPGSTLYGMSQVITMATGTAIYTDPQSKVIILTWPIETVGRAWVQLQNGSNGYASFVNATAGRGSIANAVTWAQLQEILKESGWTKILPSALSVGLMKEIGIAALSATTVVAANALPSLILVTLPPINLQDVMQSIFPPTGT